VIARRVKSLIVVAVVWGVLPASFASWLIRRLRLGAEQ